MSYQTPITVSKALERIHHHEYVIPAIQREFVWDPEQICRLFDSLLCEYPIGTFLFWKIPAGESSKYSFYDVIRDYHIVKNRHNALLTMPADSAVVAILDGQQRLTALNVGLQGSLTSRRSSSRGTTELYVTRQLYLDLLHDPNSADELSAHFVFRFLTDADARSDSAAGVHHWYPVRDVLAIKELPAAYEVVRAAGIADSCAFNNLHALWKCVTQSPIISFYELEGMSLDNVLDIFIRVNSGGTVLSKSDLLLSVATAQFTRRDARQALHELVDDLNSIGHGFRFTKDIVLKAGLVLTDEPDVRFTGLSFGKDSTERLDAKWDDIDQALRVAVHLLSAFGLSASNLTASSIVIPVADYVNHSKLGLEYLTAVRHAADRESLRKWVIRTLLKQNIWGAGLDTMLIRLRKAVRTSSQVGFPRGELETVMAELGKPLTFSESDIEALVDSSYKQPRALLLLTLLYPGIDTRHAFHVDHVFPKSQFSDTKLRDAGVPGDDHDLYQDAVNRLPNLQLLDGAVNSSKQSEWPYTWATTRYPDQSQRNGYLAANDLTSLPSTFLNFLEFFDERRSTMVRRLSELLVDQIGATAPNPFNAPPQGTAIEDPTRSSAAPRLPERDVVRSKSRKQRTHIGRELSNLQPGPIEYKYRGTVHHAVIDGDFIILSNGDRFTSPSTAALAVNGQKNINGWQAWKRDGRTIAELHP